MTTTRNEGYAQISDPRVTRGYDLVDDIRTRIHRACDSLNFPADSNYPSVEWLKDEVKHAIAFYFQGLNDEDEEPESHQLASDLFAPTSDLVAYSKMMGEVGHYVAYSILEEFSEILSRFGIEQLSPQDVEAIKRGLMH